MFLSNKYNYLIKNFQDNKDKNWNDWLEFDKLLDKPGKQGVLILILILILILNINIYLKYHNV